MMGPSLPAANIDLRGPWNTFMTGLDAVPGMNGVFTLMAVVGVALIAFALITIAWEKRRGAGGGMGGSGSKLGWVAAAGSLLAAPKVILPVLLWIVEAIANLAFNIVNSAMS